MIESKKLDSTFFSTPVIGVLAVPAKPKHLAQDYFYIAASYIKWIEGAGARTIAIPYNATEEMMDEIFEQIHLLFLPGGDAPLTTSLVYLLDKIKQRNEEGHYFPVWGTCLGFQHIIQYVAQDHSIVEKGVFDSTNVSLPLEQVVCAELYADPDVYETVVTTNVTFNSHHDGVRPQAFLANPHLRDAFIITSINQDQQGQPFISTIEPKNPDTFPFYAVQYHPEKNAYEYGVYPDMPTVPIQAIDHSPPSIEFSSRLADFVVQNLARRSVEANPTHKHTDLIKYPPVHSYLQQPAKTFEQIYLIPKNYSGALQASDSNSASRHSI